MNSIPKKIHYCWFGGAPFPELIEQCMESWQKYCPDYEIIRWDESSFDISAIPFVSEAYAAKKWAFVSDYVRLYALYHHGGIYLDTDVELYKPIDRFLHEDAFTGFETNDSPVTAIMGCKQHHPLFGELLEYYDRHSFYVDGKMDLTPNTAVISSILVSKGIRLNGRKQTVSGCTVYPSAVLCPNDLLRVFGLHSARSYCIHHFMGSWGAAPRTARRSFPQRMRMYLVKVARNTFGTKTLSAIRRKRMP